MIVNRSLLIGGNYAMQVFTAGANEVDAPCVVLGQNHSFFGIRPDPWLPRGSSPCSIFQLHSSWYYTISFAIVSWYSNASAQCSMSRQGVHLSTSSREQVDKRFTRAVTRSWFALSRAHRVAAALEAETVLAGWSPEAKYQ